MFYSRIILVRKWGELFLGRSPILLFFKQMGKKKITVAPRDVWAYNLHCFFQCLRFCAFSEEKECFLISQCVYLVEKETGIEENLTRGDPLLVFRWSEELKFFPYSEFCTYWLLPNYVINKNFILSSKVLKSH